MTNYRSMSIIMSAIIIIIIQLHCYILQLEAPPETGRVLAVARGPDADGFHHILIIVMPIMLIAVMLIVVIVMQIVIIIVIGWLPI